MSTKKNYKISNKFTEKEKEAILEKIALLELYLDGTKTLEELAEINNQRRLSWLSKNRGLIEKYEVLTLPEQAHRMLFLEHMKINPAQSKVTKVSDKKIIIQSHSFCPYLEACLILNLNTPKICKELGEFSCSEFIKAINPRLKFSRNYSKIRPEHHYCEEYIELV